MSTVCIANMVPGPQGPAGNNGTSGTNGTNAYGFTAADFVQPAVGATVQINCVSTDPFIQTQVIYIQNGGYYLCSFVNSPVLMTIQNLGYPLNSSPGTVAPSGSKIVPGGYQGPSGVSAWGEILVQEQQLSATNGGNFVSGAWRTRALNTKVYDLGGHCLGVGSSQVQIVSGTYHIQCGALAYKVDGHQTRLRNITAGTTLVTGACARSSSTDDGMTVSILEYAGTFLVNTTLSLQHQAQTTRNIDGMGKPCAFDLEVYSWMRLIREPS